MQGQAPYGATMEPSSTTEESYEGEVNEGRSCCKKGWLAGAGVLVIAVVAVIVLIVCLCGGDDGEWVQHMCTSPPCEYVVLYSRGSLETDLHAKNSQFKILKAAFWSTVEQKNKVALVATPNPPEEADNLQEYNQDFVKKFEDLKADTGKVKTGGKFIVVGYSLGAVAAVNLAAAKAADTQLASLLLIAPLGGIPCQEDPLSLCALAYANTDDEKVIDRTPDRMGLVNAPTFFIHDTDDQVVDQKSSRKLREKLTNNNHHNHKLIFKSEPGNPPEPPLKEVDPDRSKHYASLNALKMAMDWIRKNAHGMTSLP